MSVPLVSVVLPTRDRGALIERSVMSVLGQGFRELELLVVDDASRDDTLARLQRIGDDRLTVVPLPEPVGAAKARNIGVARSSGEFVAFQDSDDEWLPHKLEAQLDDLRRRDLGAVGGQYVVEAGVRKILVSSPLLESGSDYETEFLDGGPCITPVWLYRRALLQELGGFDEAMGCLEDWDLALRASQRASLGAVADVVLVKRGDQSSLGADLERRRVALKQMWQRHGDRWRRLPLADRNLRLELAYLDGVQGHPAGAIATVAAGLRDRVVGRGDVVDLARAIRRGRRTGRSEVWPPRGEGTDVR